jgi:hypothetical protein
LKNATTHWKQGLIPFTFVICCLVVGFIELCLQSQGKTILVATNSEAWLKCGAETKPGARSVCSRIGNLRNSTRATWQPGNSCRVVAVVVVVDVGDVLC